MFEEFAPSLYLADGPVVSFYGFPYPTRMAVARLSDGSTWVWSPVALTAELLKSVNDVGPVRHIVSPNKIHHLFLAEWADIDQVIFRGSLAMEEVVFFHRESRTAIFCDLIQRHPETAMTGWKGMLMKLDSLVGEQGSTPREWRASFLRRSKARAAREKVLGWNPERLLIAHGECAKTNASKIIEEALSWI